MPDSDEVATVRGSLKHRRRTLLACIPIAVLTCYLAEGPGVAVAALILLLPPLAWAFDNKSGTLLLLAVLFVIAVAVMVLLIALMALAH